VVTDRLEDGKEVWVRAQYAPESDGLKCSPQSAASGQTGETVLEALESCVLIASPHMHDDWFEQAVVLVLYHGPDETFGVVLNRPTGETAGQLWEEMGAADCDNHHSVHAGGPEDGPLLILHTNESCADAQVAPGVYVATEPEHLERMARQQNLKQRVLLGIACWGAGQLEDEVRAGDWLLVPATEALLFAEPDRQWPQALRFWGHTFLRSIGVKHIPDDPQRN
jgi:putative transcriptional regulator